MRAWILLLGAAGLLSGLLGCETTSKEEEPVDDIVDTDDPNPDARETTPGGTLCAAGTPMEDGTYSVRHCLSPVDVGSGETRSNDQFVYSPGPIKMISQ